MKTDKNRLIIGAAACAFALSGVTMTAIALEPAVAAEPAAEAQQDGKALEIIDAYIEKLGGEDAIKSIASTKILATFEVPMAGLTGTMTMMSKVPGHVSMVMDMPGFGKTESGFDGTVGWSSDPMSGPRLMTEDEVDALKKQADPAAAMKYRDLYPTIEYAGETNFEGRKAHKLRLVDEKGKEQFEFFDVASSLMVGQEGAQDTPMGEINILTVLSDYKEFDGMQMPTKMVQRMGPQEMILTITSVEMNTVDDSAFVLPDAIKALVEASEDG